MKHLELLKFPTYKASFSFNFSSNFYSLVCSLSPLRGTFIGMGTVIAVTKLSKSPTSNLKPILQNGVQGEIGIVSIGHMFYCQINDY